MPVSEISSSSSSSSSSSCVSSEIDLNNNDFKIGLAMPVRVEYLLNMEQCNFGVKKQHAWNSKDSSRNIYVSETDPFLIHRFPVAESTDCIRTKQSYSKGIHLFKITWKQTLRGTHAVIGVATAHAPLHCEGYKQLIGNNSFSWGWNLTKKLAYHGSEETVYPAAAAVKQNETFKVPDEFIMCLDMDLKTLSFIVNGQYLGEAFKGLKGDKLFPVVSCVWGHAEIKMEYLNGLDLMPLRLLSLCRICIRQKIGTQRLTEINDLNLPTVMKKYLINNNSNNNNTNN
jgi:SPRY domain-containing SOCS box protein 1/4